MRCLQHIDLWLVRAASLEIKQARRQRQHQQMWRRTNSSNIGTVNAITSWRGE